VAFEFLLGVSGDCLCQMFALQITNYLSDTVISSFLFYRVVGVFGTKTIFIIRIISFS
jgi:hypothetical protein